MMKNTSTTPPSSSSSCVHIMEEESVVVFVVLIFWPFRGKESVCTVVLASRLASDEERRCLYTSASSASAIAI